MLRRPLVAFIAILLLNSSVIAQDPAVLPPKNYQTVFENDQVAVVHVHYGSHEELSEHAHSHYPTVYVYLSNSGPVRFSHDTEAHPFALNRRPVKIGWFRVSPGRIETHTVVNLGPMASDFLRVELKRIPLGTLHDEFRFSGDIDLTKSSAAVNDTSRELTIERYVAVADHPQQIDAALQPRLLIAFTPIVVRKTGHATQTMAAGSVLWWQAGTSAQIVSTSVSPAHVLSIRLLR